MAIKLGSSAISSLKLGTQDVSSISLGSTQLFSTAPPPTGLSVINGVQPLQTDISGLSVILAEGEENDEDSIQISIPFGFNFYGVDYGLNQNGGVYLGTNGYLSFSMDYINYNIFYPLEVPLILFSHIDLVMIGVTAAGSGPLVKDVQSFVVRFKAYEYYNDTDVIEADIIFYEGNKIQINYGVFDTPNSSIEDFRFGLGNTGDPGLSSTWTPTIGSPTSFALSSDETGTNWTVQPGYWG